MTAVTIEYCVPCGHLGRALEMQEALLEQFGQNLDGVTLQPGDGGVFEVRVDGRRVWDKNVPGDETPLETAADAIHAQRTE